MLTARRETLSIYTEVRALAWIGVMLIATGAGILVKKHFDDIGPLTIAIVIGLAGAACYGYVILSEAKDLKFGPPRSFAVSAAQDDGIHDYIVLLGALLISADIGFIERTWKLLGTEWQRHMLLLAVLHAAAAYFFRSRAVLSLSLAAFATWMAAEHPPATSGGIAVRAFVCAGAFLAFRAVNRREEFRPVFEHFAAHTAFAGAIALTIDPSKRWIGAAIGIGFAIASVVYGFRRRRELFVIYGYVYGLIVVNIFVATQLGMDVLIVFFQLCSIVVAIVAMIVTHVRWRK